MKTKFLYLSLLSMLFVLISTTSVSAQDYNIFAKQKQVINACVNSDKYEVSEVNMNDVKKNITSKGLQPTTTNYAPPTQAQRKQVGDIININGVKAIVYKVDNSGQHGMAMSLDEEYLEWDDARKWCSNLGSGWRLPSKSELLEIYRNKEQLNKALSQSGYGLAGCHWSSDEYNRDCVCFVDLYDGSAGFDNKSYNFYVLAVSAF